jgi:hypothetical protein
VGPRGQMPAPGSEIARAASTLAALTRAPDFGDLSPAVRKTIVNWPLDVIFAANGQPWDIIVGDALANSFQGTGGVFDGGGAFTSFGDLRLRVLDTVGTVLIDNHVLGGFGLAFDGQRRLSTTTPVTVSGVSVERSLLAPSGTDYLRYVDAFTNTSASPRIVEVAWGGGLESRLQTLVARTSSGELPGITQNDRWAVTIASNSGNPNEAVLVPPVGFAVGDRCTEALVRLGEFSTNPFAFSWAGRDNLSYVYRLTLAPGETARLAYFLYRGLHVGFPSPENCGRLGFPPCQIAMSDAEINKAAEAVEALVAAPDFGDLTAAERASIVNWGYCEDRNACTADGCDPAEGCTHAPIDCDDDDPCTEEAPCNPATGCVRAALVGLAGVTCAFDYDLAQGACLDQNVPSSVGKKFAKARTLAERAAGTEKVAKQERFLRKSAGLLKSVLGVIKRAENRKGEKRLAPECASLLRGIVEGARARALEPPA